MTDWNDAVRRIAEARTSQVEEYLRTMVGEGIRPEEWVLEETPMTFSFERSRHSGSRMVMRQEIRLVPRPVERQHHELTKVISDEIIHDTQVLGYLVETMQGEFNAAVGDRVSQRRWTLRIEGEDD